MIAEENASLCKAIGLTSKLLGIYINDNLQLGGLKLTRNQFVVLKILSLRQGICQGELAFITERDKTSLTRLISTLESKGMVKRNAARDDRRKKKIYVTDLGLVSLNDARPLMKKLEDEVAKGLTSEELNSLQHILNKVQANVLNLHTEIE